jgi:HEPN domain-containing protein
MKDEKDPFDLQAMEWIRKAQDDELNAVAILKHRDGTPSMVCFISQQITEKCLKAFLIHAVRDYPKVHLVDKLLELCIKEDDSFSVFKNDAILLNEYYIEARYPDSMSVDDFTWEMAEQAYNAAKKIKDFVLGKI